MQTHRVFATSIKSVCPLHVRKEDRKGPHEGGGGPGHPLADGVRRGGAGAAGPPGCDLEAFIAEAPAFTPSRSLVTRVACAVRVEEIAAPRMRKTRCLDSRIDELGKARSMEKALRA